MTLLHMLQSCFYKNYISLKVMKNSMYCSACYTTYWAQRKYSQIYDNKHLIIWEII